MRKNYPYLKDAEYMYLADTQKLQNQFIKLTLLDWNENPLEEIQGIATGGTISMNGKSAVRRTCSLNMTVKDISTGHITDTKNLISINKKVYIEIGIVNKTDKYKEYPILWYPQGIFVFTQCNVNIALSQGTTLSAQLKDKMCLLNGECGGIITAAVILDHYDTLDDTTGKMITTKPTIAKIIRELVNHFGGEQLGRIIINDIDEKAKMTMRWTGANPLYLATKDSSHLFTTSEAEARNFGGTVQEFFYGQDVGFIYTDFTWANGELTANAGDNICTILDKIKNFLGNYEYYYDIDGNFIFQEIKDYLNTTQATIDLKNMDNNNYIVDMTKGKSVYDFSDSKLIVSFANNPQYNRIKNDFVVWGIRENISGNKLPIRYHLAIDKKPTIGNIYEVFFYEDPTDGLRKAKCPVKYENFSRFPETGAEGVFYLDKNTGRIYKWDGELNQYVSIEGSKLEEYNSSAGFPEAGQEGIVYVSTSDNKLYSWALVPGSLHYNTIAAQLTSLKAEYENSLRPYQDEVDSLNLVKQHLEEDLDTYYDVYRKWLIQEKNLNKELTNLDTQKNDIEDAIDDKQSQCVEYQQIVDNKIIEIAELQAEYDAETNPFRKNELQQMIDNATLEKNSAEMYVTNLTEDISKLENQLIPINAEIADIQSQLTPIETQLVDYYSAKESIEDQIAATDNQIIEIENQIGELENQYITDRTDLLSKQGEYIDYVGESLVYVQATDWRSELYLAGAAAEPLGLESNYYYTELAAEWPKLYNLQANSYTDSETGHTIYTGAFYDNILENPWDVDYWLDFIDSEAAISMFNISNIGRRSITKNSDDYNCIFEAEVPDIVIIETGDEAEEKRKECEDRNQDYCQVGTNIYEALAIGGLHNSCFNEIKNLLWENTNYNSSISISIIPIFHLEPNTRITVQSNDADIHGDFIIQSISLPLAINGNMSISATQVQTKL